MSSSAAPAALSSARSQGTSPRGGGGVASPEAAHLHADGPPPLKRSASDKIFVEVAKLAAPAEAASPTFETAVRSNLGLGVGTAAPLFSSLPVSSLASPLSAAAAAAGGDGCDGGSGGGAASSAHAGAPPSSSSLPSPTAGLLEKRDQLVIRTRDVVKYQSKLHKTVATLGGTVTGLLNRIATDEPGATRGPGTLYVTQLRDEAGHALVHYEVVGDAARCPAFATGDVYRFGAGVDDRVRLVQVHGPSLFGVVDNSTRGKKPAIKLDSGAAAAAAAAGRGGAHGDGCGGPGRSGGGGAAGSRQSSPQEKDRWVPVAASKLAKDRAAVANAMAKLAAQPDASVELVSFMEALTRGGRAFKTGMVVERQLQPTGEKLAAEVAAVHSDTVHFSNFRDSVGRPLVCFRATHPGLYIVGQVYKSTAPMRNILGGPAQEGYQVEFRGASGQYIFGVPNRRPPPYGCAGGAETTNTRELAARRRDEEAVLPVQSRCVSRYREGQSLAHPGLLVQSTPITDDVKVQGVIRAIKHEGNDAAQPDSGVLFLGDFKQVHEYGDAHGRALLWYHCTHPDTFLRGKTYMSASLGRTFEFLCHDAQGNVFGYPNDHLHNTTSHLRTAKRKAASPAAASATATTVAVAGATAAAHAGGYNPGRGAAPPAKVVQISRADMITLKKTLREQADPLVVRAVLESMNLVPVHQPHWNEKPPRSRMEFGYYGNSVLEYARLHELPSFPALQQWRYY